MAVAVHAATASAKVASFGRHSPPSSPIEVAHAFPSAEQQRTAALDVIGVAFQNQQDSQNIGYVIPVPTIEHFLADGDPESGGTLCRGFCSLGIRTLTLCIMTMASLQKLHPSDGQHSEKLAPRTIPTPETERLAPCAR